MSKKCQVPNCNGKYHAKGFCGKHYRKKRQSEFSEEEIEYNRILNNKRSEKYRNDPKNHNKISERGKIYRRKPENKEKIRSLARQRYKDPIKGKIIKEKRAIYRAIPENKVREKVRASTYNRLYALNNRERINQNRVIRTTIEKHSINQQRNFSRNKKYSEYRIKLLKILADKCQNCGFSHYEALDIEHKFNTGNKDKKKFNRKDDMYRYYFERPSEAMEYLQIFCHNCNMKKEYEHRKKNIKNETSISRIHRDMLIKQEIMFILNQHECQNCRLDEFIILERDHIHNDGSTDRKRFNNNHTKMWKYYITNPEECRKRIQILCANCNSVKSRYGENGLKKLRD